jgi:hypothetical protein
MPAPEATDVALSTDLESPDAVPYFLWDEPMTNRELRVERRWCELSIHLGRRRPFWEFLFEEWKRQGLLGSGVPAIVSELRFEAAPPTT